MNQTIAWLLAGDVSVQYMTHKLLLDSNPYVTKSLQERIGREGFGAAFLSCRSENGHWGRYYYQPKWTSTHYTLLDLKCLGVPDTLEPCRQMVKRMFDECMKADGGMNLSRYEHPSDICIDGMVLNYAAYFASDDPRVIRLAAHLLSVQKADGGFTWNEASDRGDPHTTICVLEGLGQLDVSLPACRLAGIPEAKARAAAFLFANDLFFNDPDKRFRKLSYPYRYRYDFLRALEYFASGQIARDDRMQPALGWLSAKRQKNGLWHLENSHKGNVHFQMEDVGRPSRFITLK